MLKLLIQDDEGRKTLVPFSRDEITIGREDGNTIRLTERNVSRRHARLFRHSAQIFVEDLKSHNGVQLNGRRIRGQAVVRKGDTIGIGDYDIILEGSFPAPPLPSQKNAESPDASSPPDNMPLAAEAPSEQLPGENTAATTLESERGAEHPGDNAPSSQVDFAASIAFVNTLDLAEESPQEEDAFKSSVSFKSSAASKEAAAAKDAAAAKEAAKSKDMAAYIASRETLDLDEGHPQGERPTLRLPEFTELPESESPRIVALNLDFRGREFVCSRSEFSMGHSNINDLVLKHSSVAPIHCRIERDAQGLWFVAVDPRYPVLVNGAPCQPFALEHGDILTLGKLELQFFLPPSQQFQPTSRKKKSAPSKFRPFGIGLFLAFLVALAFLYLYWSIGALHESSSTALSSFAYQFLPLPPPLQLSSEKKLPPPNLPPPPLLAPPPATPPEASAVEGSAPPTSEAPPEIPTSPPESTGKSETARLQAVLQPPQKSPEADTPSKFDKALEKNTGRLANKTAVPANPVRPVAKAPRETRETKASPVAAPGSLEPVEPEIAQSPTFNDVDLFWEDVYLLQKKAEREFTAAAKRATLSSLHDKLSACETARCAYELAKTSLLLSKLGSAHARTRYPDEFEAYLKMQDVGRQARARKEDACKILLSYYNSAEHAAKVQTLSGLCTR